MRMTVQTGKLDGDAQEVLHGLEKTCGRWCGLGKAHEGSTGGNMQRMAWVERICTGSQRCFFKGNWIAFPGERMKLLG